MNTHVLDLGEFSLSLPDGWSELPSDEDNLNSPITIADGEGGVGALQVSIAKYKSGKLPNVTCSDLQELIDDFSETRGLTYPFDQQSSSNGTRLVGQSFHSGDDFIRVWYISNGKSIVLLTYVCEWNDRGTEAGKRDLVANSIRFHETELD